jgi:Ca-activated chloride channel family protein
MMGKKDGRWAALAVMVTASILALTMCVPTVSAQQHEYEPAPEIPQNRPQSGSGATLEVPVNRGQQGNPVAPLSPLTPQSGQELSVAPHALRNQSGYEQVTVTVTNQRGNYETGLEKDDLKLYVDGLQRPIEYFRHDLNAPVSVGILVDTSGSMTPKIPQARAAIAEFIGQLNDRDDVFLFAFSDRDWLLQPFTTDHQRVLSKLELLTASGQTSLFDTIIDGLLMLRHGTWDKKALLVVTDGMDNTSQAELQQVVAYARRMGVLIYSIGIGEEHAAVVSFGPFTLPGEDEVDAPTLRELSSETGAKTYIFRTIGDGVAMREACRSISEELREQYTVGFVAPDASRGGYRNLRVDVPKHPEDTVRVRKGVTVSGETASASTGSLGLP